MTFSIIFCSCNHYSIPQIFIPKRIYKAMEKLQLMTIIKLYILRSKIWKNHVNLHLKQLHFLSVIWDPLSTPGQSYYTWFKSWKNHMNVYLKANKKIFHKPSVGVFASSTLTPKAPSIVFLEWRAYAPQLADGYQEMQSFCRLRRSCGKVVRLW